MATTNPFDLLGDDDNDDPSVLIATLQQKVAQQVAPTPKKAVAAAGLAPVKQANLPSKPVPPAQSVREAKSEAGRGVARGEARGGGGAGRGYGRGGGGRGGYNREQGNNGNTFGSNDGVSGGYKQSEEKDGYARQPYRGTRNSGFNNGEAVEGERPRRQYERRSGTGRGNGVKRDGAGRGNWGTATEEIAPENEELVNENEKSAVAEKQVAEEEAGDAGKENPVTETEEKEPEPEDKEMTLEEYEKVLEEKRKALLAQKTEERKVDLDKELKSMQLLSSKKTNDEIFAKLGVDKDKRKEAADKEEKAKKSLSINEFLKPAEGERYYNPSGGRGRGRGRGPRGGYNGGTNANTRAPPIEDNAHFPTLGGK